MTRNKDSARRFWIEVDKHTMDRGFNLYDIADAALVPYGTIISWRSKHLFPDIETVLLISQKLSCTVECLMGLEIQNRTMADDVYDYMYENMPSLLNDIQRQINFKKGSGYYGPKIG